MHRLHRLRWILERPFEILEMRIAFPEVCALDEKMARNNEVSGGEHTTDDPTEGSTDDSINSIEQSEQHSFTFK